MEYQREEQTYCDSYRQHKSAYISVKTSKDRDYPADFIPVALSNGQIECITYRGSNSKFGKVEKTENVLQCACKAYEIRPEMVEEYLA